MKENIFILGKGGVGKSTLAVALALKKKNRLHSKKLLVSFDPAHNIGDILGLKISGRRKKVHDELEVWEVDLQKAVEDYLKESARELSRSFKTLQVLNLEGYLDMLTLAPGTLEQASYLVLKEVLEERETLKIIDMPPTGLALRILALPWINNFWLEKLMKLRKTIIEKREKLAKIEGREREEDPLYNELERLSEESMRTTALIQRSLIILLMEPEKLSLKETERAVEMLGRLGLKPDFYVVNKLGRPPYPATSPSYFPGVPKLEIPWIEENVAHKMSIYLDPILEALR